MAGFGEKAVQRWNDWQLIVLVLLSLAMQLLLLVTAGFRRRIKPSWRSKIYFAALHLGSRYITAYPLGILSRSSTKNPNADIQAFWAALLLFHMGGPDDFTALSLEDNKIWHRQCFELSVQFTITAYVFIRHCVDPDFKRFILPYLLISLAGMLKCVEQVFALKQATMEALIKSVLGTPDAGPDYADTMDRVDGMLRSGILPYINIDSGRLRRVNSDAPETGETISNENAAPQLALDMSVEDTPVVADQTGADQNPAVITSAADAGEARETRTGQDNLNIIRSAYSLFSTFKVLFADGLFSFENRRESQALFSGKKAEWAFKVIEIELSFVYDRLYTKASVSRSETGMAIRLASLLLILAGSLYTFLATVRATQYLPRHRYVTYALLLGALCTEAFILAMYFYSIWSLALVGSESDSLKWLSGHLVEDRPRWSGYMAQSNLITFCLQKLPSDGWFDLLLINFSRGSSQGRPYIPVLLSIAGILAPSLLLPIIPYIPALLIRGPALQAQASEAVRGAVSQYLQRPSVLEQLQSKGFWEKFDKTTYISVRKELKEFIFSQVKEKEGILIIREESYRTTGIPDRSKSFVDCRGDWVLEKENEYAFLGWSFRLKEFDESLLLWHIATDLCFRQDVNQGNNSSGQQVNSVNGGTDQQTKKYMENGKEISNYMLYIMVVHPLMLSSSTTMITKRCRDTCAEARRHFLKEHIQAKFSSGSAGGSISEENAHASLLKVKTTLRASAVKGDKSKSVLWDGCFLAKQLNEIPEKDRKWRVISSVWVEMLCYAAVQCGGYQHAERLKEGGELITFVCLLMTHLGMGKHYRTEIGDAYAHLSPFTAQSAYRPAPPSQAQGIQKNTTISVSRDQASTSGHGQEAATVSVDEASTCGHGQGHQ